MYDKISVGNSDISKMSNNIKLFNCLSCCSMKVTMRTIKPLIILMFIQFIM